MKKPLKWKRSETNKNLKNSKNKAKLNVCEIIELEEQFSLVKDLAHIPPESKGEQVRQYSRTSIIRTRWD